MRTIFAGLILVIITAVGWVSLPLAWANYYKLSIPQIKYRGGNFNPRPDVLSSFLGQVAKRTSIEVNREPIQMQVTEPALYQYPFIYMGGDDSFEPFSSNELRVLRNYLSYGGFLLIDDNSGKKDSAFDRSAREMISRLFPQVPLQKISRDHSIFRSFYLINQVAGRVNNSPFLEGIHIKGRAVLVYCANDLAGTWARNNLGHWDYDIIGGGERQRQLSIRLGVNIVMYSLTLDYKKDMVHLPIILERLRKYHSQ